MVAPTKDKIAEILTQLHEYERVVLPLLTNKDEHKNLAKSSGFDAIQLSRAFQWLSNKELITLEYKKDQYVVLGENGKLCAKNKLPEVRVLTILADGKSHSSAELLQKGISQQEIGACIGILKVMGAADITKTEQGLEFKITTFGKGVNLVSHAQQQFLEKKFPIAVSSLTESEKIALAFLQKRKQMVELETHQTPIVALTELGKVIAKQDLTKSASLNTITSEVLQNGEWKEKPIRPFDVTSRVPAVYGGRIHPMTAVIRLVKQIFVEMGFSEMEGPWVETSFWCMDSMWIPQDHPARDVQDTFYLQKQGDLPSPQIVQKVKEEHETGKASGSKGYKYTWDPKKAEELILRTHTTATTFRTLANSADEKILKKFYVGKVFRNEAIDATHLPEFYQVEGFVMGDDLNLQHLLGTITEFYTKLGFTKIKFKPTYNPYTESSLEAFYFDEKRGKWMELINSGMFRPESLAPYGITKPIIAWGLGLERLAMLMLEQGKLKDIIGPQTDLRWLRTYKAPMRQN